MKTDRLIAITTYLLSHELASASKLAKRFEVSKRTIQRDMEVLCQAGIPISSSFGSGGGYQIMDGFSLTKQIAGAEDYQNIVTALKGYLSAYHSNSIQETLEKACASMRHGSPRVFIYFTVAQEKPMIKESLNIIEKAIACRKPLRIRYTNAEFCETQRIVEPLALSFQWYAWYLFAYCTLKQDYRLFKIIRITCCEPLDGIFSKTHGDVEALIKSALVSDSRKVFHVKLLCKPAVRQQVLEYLSSNIVQESENGDFVAEFHAPYERMWFSLILGFGNQVTVLEPPELRSMVKQAAEEILSIP